MKLFSSFDSSKKNSTDSDSLSSRRLTLPTTKSFIDLISYIILFYDVSTAWYIFFLFIVKTYRSMMMMIK